MRKILYTVQTMLSPLTLASLLIVTTLRTVTSYPFREGGSLAELMLVLYGGVEWNMFITFRQIAYWIMFLLPYLFGIVQHFTDALQNHLRLTLYRSGSKAAWWTGEMIALTLYVLVLTVLAVLISLCVGYGAGMRGLEMYLTDATGLFVVSTTRWLLAPAMAALNALLFSYLYATTFLLWRDTRISTFVYIVPTIIYLLRYSNEERIERLSCIINWSMVQRYALLAANGLSEMQAIARFALTVLIVFIIAMTAVRCINPFRQQMK